jgi:uncharacterized Zn-finger protein
MHLDSHALSGVDTLVTLCRCEECNKTFSRSVNLRAHKRAAHSDVRPFGCQLCMNRFKTKAHLVKHLSCIHKDLMKSVVNCMKEEQPSK